MWRISNEIILYDNSKSVEEEFSELEISTFGKDELELHLYAGLREDYESIRNCCQFKPARPVGEPSYGKTLILINRKDVRRASGEYLRESTEFPPGFDGMQALDYIANFARNHDKHLKILLKNRNLEFHLTDVLTGSIEKCELRMFGPEFNSEVRTKLRGLSEKPVEFDELIDNYTNSLDHYVDIPLKFTEFTEILKERRKLRC